MTARNSRFYCDYWDKLADEYLILIIVLLVRKSIDADYAVLTEELQTNPKASKLRVGNKVKVVKYKKSLSKGYT